VSVSVRRVAAYAIRERNPRGDRVIAGLTLALNDIDISVRQNAAGALGSYGKEATTALESLNEHLGDLALAPWIDCAINRIVNDNRPNRYGSMTFRSAQSDLPEWPPARASTHQELSDEYLAGIATLKDAYLRLSSALKARSYDVEVLKAPGGFALASRAERYNPATGESLPEPDRWSTVPTHLSLDSSLIWHFISGKDVHVRIFLFVVTDLPIEPIYRKELDSGTFLDWVYARSDLLPSAVKQESYVGKHCFAFVYNFSGKQRSLTLQFDSPNAVKQLEQAGIMEGVEVYAAKW
jgi:hypothetical protein